MVYHLIFEILFYLTNWQPATSASIINQLKYEVILAHKKNKVELTELTLRKLVAAKINEPEISANLAITLYQQKKYKEAKLIFEDLRNSKNIIVASEANIHLGFLNCIKGDTVNAIINFENALVKNNKNERAKYNLELIKKQFKESAQEKKSKEKSNSVEIQKNSTQNFQPDELSEKEQTLARLNKLNLTESQAKSIFDAINAAELKYLQKKKQVTGKEGNYQNW
jgi:Tfp pilus assembly protein PilF